MHIPDGFLGPKTCLVCYLAAAPFWIAAWRGLRSRLETSFEVPYVAVASAFVFVLMLFNVPIPGGTSGHAVGTALVAVALGVGPAVLSVSFALAVQALLFQDGGITVFGANALAMAVVQALVARGVWLLLRGEKSTDPSRKMFWAAFAAAYAATMASAILTGFLLGVQPVLERSADGIPLYFPIGLKVTMSAMLLSHLVIGVLEGAITGFAVTRLARMPGVLPQQCGPGPVGAAGAAIRQLIAGKKFWATSAVAILLAPLGLWLPAWAEAGEPWGEWGSSELLDRARLSRMPEGLEKLSGLWSAPVPDYQMDGTFPGGESAEYILAAVLGVAAISVFFVFLGRWQRKQARPNL